MGGCGVDFTDRRAVVTGSASGIGAAVARALAAAGAEVIGIGRRRGASAGDLVADLGDPASIDAVATRIDGSIDMLFNCVGLAPTQPLRPVIAVNFLGIRHLTEALLPKMAARGAIVSVSSNGGLAWRERRAELAEFLACADFAAGLACLERHEAGIASGYRFAKEALTMWTLAQSARLIGRGVRINCISPGAVSTPMLDELERAIPAATIDLTTRPIGRRSSPDEQAAAALFLASDAASYVNGVDLAVDGGFSASLAIDGRL